jgi:uncharacterized membrane protein
MEKESKSTKETLDAWHDNPSNRKWGIFYFNKKDNRIFLPKRMKYAGWTVNFANPYSILALLVVLILIDMIAQRLV